MEDCIFCKIVAKQIPADIKFEDNEILVFKDIAPKAKIHWLVVPKKHIPSLQALTSEDSKLAGHLIMNIPTIAFKAGVNETGYKVFMNTGPHGEQVVPHIHMHLMGGEPLHGPTRVS
ncbi:MAG: histidine triad nucleotide-binding protein [Patescibacteria group bacterium]